MAKQLKHIILASAFAFASLIAGASSSFAQTSGTPAQTLPKRSGKYLSDAVELARLLGKAHAIRVTCNGRADQFWRLYMQEMMDLEAPVQGGLRDSMARAFNDAYASESALRSWCSEETVAAEAEYARQGLVIAEYMAQYYFKRSE